LWFVAPRMRSKTCTRKSEWKLHTLSLNQCDYLSSKRITLISDCLNLNRCSARSGRNRLITRLMRACSKTDTEYCAFTGADTMRRPVIDCQSVHQSIRVLVWNRCFMYKIHIVLYSMKHIVYVCLCTVQKYVYVWKRCCLDWLHYSLCLIFFNTLLCSKAALLLRYKSIK